MRIPLLSGRAFSESDTRAAPSVAAINRTRARRFWPNESPLGKRLLFRNSPLAGEAPISLTIVDVVGDVRWMRMPIRPFDIEAQPTVYGPFLQSQGELGFLCVRVGIDPRTLVDPIRKEIRAIDPDIAVSVTTPEHALDGEMARPRLNLVLIAIFAMIALLLSTGTFVVVAYSAATRTHEIGIRMAFGGAKRGHSPAFCGMGSQVSVGRSRDGRTRIPRPGQVCRESVVRRHRTRFDQPDYSFAWAGNRHLARQLPASKNGH